MHEARPRSSDVPLLVSASRYRGVGVMCLVPKIYVMYGVQIVQLIGALMQLGCNCFYLSFYADPFPKFPSVFSTALRGTSSVSF